jgi:hypothetical protein
VFEVSGGAALAGGGWVVAVIVRYGRVVFVWFMLYVRCVCVMFCPVMSCFLVS